MSGAATIDHCGYCFDVLESKLNGGSPDSDVQPLFASASFPLFVSWYCGGALRGCIGTFEPLDLHAGLREYALIAGTYYMI